MTTGKSDEFFTMLGKTLSSCKDGERCGDIFFPKISKGFSTTFSCSEKKKSQINHRYISTHSEYCHWPLSVFLEGR